METTCMKRIAAALIVCTAVCLSPAFAKTGSGGALKNVQSSLSADQKKRIQSIKAANKAKITALKTEVKELQAKAKTQKSSTDLAETTKKIKELQAQLKAARDASKAQVKGVLTAEQKSKVQ